MQKIFQYKNIIFTLILFLIFLPLSLSIQFLQNDDWVYFLTVQNFLNFDFSLDPAMGTTYYSQAFPSFLFSLVFGIEKLPVLTLIVSVLNLYIFNKTLQKFYKLSFFTSSLFSLVLFFNPLYFYSILGIMTENFTVFFFLVSLYFFLNYEKNLDKKSLIFNILGSLLAFFHRQVGIVLPFSFFVYFLYKKRFKDSLVQLGVFISMLITYFFVLPRSNVMSDRGFNTDLLFNFNDLFPFLLKISLYLFALLLPISIFVLTKIIKKKKIKIAMSLFILLGAFFLTSYLLKESYFPYLWNTFERPGFFKGGVFGNKYHFIGVYKIFNFFNLWGTLAVITFSSFISYLIIKKNKLKIINIHFILISIYIGLLVLFPYFYDRYLVPIVPIFLLFVVHIFQKFKLLDKVFIALFTVFTLFISLQFALDYVGWQNYVWNKAEELESSGINRQVIHANHSWRRMNGVTGIGSSEYVFSFDSPDESDPNFKLIETHENKYPLNIFIEPKVYLYQIE